jgi:predicted tellurium resistance membrane protein TerC
MQESILLNPNLAGTNLLKLILITFKLIFLFSYLHHSRIQQIHTGIVLNGFLPRPGLFLIMAMVQLLPPPLQMRERNFGVSFLETHRISSVVTTMLGHQLSNVLNCAEKQFALLRYHRFAHQHC